MTIKEQIAGYTSLIAQHDARVFTPEDRTRTARIVAETQARIGKPRKSVTIRDIYVKRLAKLQKKTTPV